jgi:ABC-type multidrug transport system fused ATPase/permease subunit
MTHALQARASKVVERGKHDELIGKGGVYSRLHDLQSFN